MIPGRAVRADAPLGGLRRKVKNFWGRGLALLQKLPL